MGRPTVRNICFHGIGAPGRTIDDAEARYWISYDGYRRILDEIVTWPAIGLSFDDGNDSDVTLGLPALVDRGLTATFFPLAARLDRPGSLSTAQVAGLRTEGMRVGSHGMDHVSWRNMPSDTRHRELVEAREVLESVAGPITEAALPRGQYDRTSLAWLRRLGYEVVHTSDQRPARPGAWIQPRFSVTRDDTPETLVQRVLTPRAAAERSLLAAKGLLKRMR